MPRTLQKKDWFHTDGFPIAVERRERQEPFGLHAHDFSELVIITRGRAVHVTGAESWPLAAGDVFVITGPQAHDYRELRDLGLINILFDPAKLALDLRDLPALPGYHALFTLEPAWRKRHRFQSRLRLAPKDLGHATALVEQLEAELRSRQAGFRFLATSLFMQLAGFLSRCYGQSRNADTRALLRIAEAMTHLEIHSADAIHLDDLARRAHMSKRSFIRAFQAATGEPPIAYLIHLRVNRAAEMLRRTDESITEIAFRAGFSDSNYFARQFRKLHGMTPRQYRAQRSG